MEQAREKFDGDLLLALAVEGRLVLDAELADCVVAELRRTEAIVHGRLAALGGPGAVAGLDQETVDLRFAEVAEPGRLRAALAQLPRYIAAFEQATRVSTQVFTPR
ncbi:hypothetical protein [Amycolatopsis sp. NPDC059657]|uniref:hypothetical protein n=1 Tax=Amycolatopsis sp. NPDC059657 TaxID=3346899 RepID=UPI00366FFFE1